MSIVKDSLSKLKKEDEIRSKINKLTEDDDYKNYTKWSGLTTTLADVVNKYDNIPIIEHAGKLVQPYFLQRALNLNDLKTINEDFYDENKRKAINSKIIEACKAYNYPRYNWYNTNKSGNSRVGYQGYLELMSSDIATDYAEWRGITYEKSYHIDAYIFISAGFNAMDIQGVVRIADKNDLTDTELLTKEQIENMLDRILSQLKDSNKLVLDFGTNTSDFNAFDITCPLSESMTVEDITQIYYEVLSPLLEQMFTQFTRAANPICMLRPQDFKWVDESYNRYSNAEVESAINGIYDAVEMSTGNDINTRLYYKNPSYFAYDIEDDFVHMWVIHPYEYGTSTVMENLWKYLTHYGHTITTITNYNSDDIYMELSLSTRDMKVAQNKQFEIDWSKLKHED